ncbi:MAG: hypothetical protein ACTHWZ_08260 [Peptoniphilaceae bacterium]
MIKTLLINQIDTIDDYKNRNIFFLIGNMEEATDVLLDNFNSVNCKYYGRSTLKYNGIKLNITTKEIPELVRLLVGLGLDIYGVYELYEPK